MKKIKQISLFKGEKTILPNSAEILSVTTHYRGISLNVLVDKDDKTENNREFIMIDGEDEIEDNDLKYIGTVTFDNRFYFGIGYTVHVFEQLNPKPCVPSEITVESINI